MSQHSAACCSIPPVVAKDYQEKGTYIQLDGLKTYSTGFSDAKNGILFVYDIFGYYPQTIQGADILAHSDSEKPYQVFMPDFFEGSPADLAWYPPDTKEKGEKLGEFFNTTAAPPKALERIPKLVEAIKKDHGVEKLAILGFCWGGKIANLSSQKGTPFGAAAACHPAMVDPEDAPKVTIPIALLPSKDEDKEAVEKYKEALKVKNMVKYYPDQIHGWMAARSDLEDEKVKKQYEDGYRTVLHWFHENL